MKTLGTASEGPSLDVLQLHNFYRWGAGEDDAVRATCSLLQRRGIRVRTVTRDSRATGKALTDRIRMAGQGIWSRAAYDEVCRIVRERRPDVAHVHNVYPMLSPSVIAACRDLEVPVVMTCHNYRLLCPIGLLFRDGEVCSRCTGTGRETWCIVHNCRGHAAESAAYALRAAAARVGGGFSGNVTRFIVPSRFTGQVLAGTGVPADRIDVLGCLIPAPAPNRRVPGGGTYVGFAGRLSEEKGANVLLGAATLLPEVPFRVAGDGPLRDRLERAAPPNVSFVGQLDSARLGAFYEEARVIAVPSLCYETFGIVPAEAMSHGVPVVASRFGALPELVEDQVCGLLHDRADAEDLAAKLRTLWNHPLQCARMGERGRAKIASTFGEDNHVSGLISSYSKAIGDHRASTAAGRRRSA